MRRLVLTSICVLNGSPEQTVSSRRLIQFLLFVYTGLWISHLKAQIIFYYLLFGVSSYLNTYAFLLCLFLNKVLPYIFTFCVDFHLYTVNSRYLDFSYLK